MMPLADYHVHTVFCDGKNTPEEVVKAAIEKDMDAIGFSGHSHTAFDESWCMSVDGTAAYRKEISRLKKAYAGKIKIFCGVEQDYFSDASTEGYDYVIGSVHYLCVNGEYIPVDESAEDLKAAAEKQFGGDMMALCEKYYRTAANVCEKTNCDIIGHFDLITKFNNGGALFDENDPRYIAAWQKAADKLLRSGKVFEINTGAISRGYRTQPYPSADIRSYIKAKGGTFILSGDSHSADTLCFQFDRWNSELD